MQRPLSPPRYILVRLWLICLLVWSGHNLLVLTSSTADELPAPSTGPGTAPCAPTATQAPDASEVILQADTLDYQRQEKRLIATGNVSVVRGTTHILADRLELNTETGLGTATGQVQVTTPDDHLNASQLDFDLSAERGVVYNGTGVVANSYQVTGERVERLGARQFVVQRGSITTCTGAVPDWAFRSRQARIGLGDYVTLQQPSFWIKGIPVFYLPYFIFPLKPERTTGFLPPHFGFSRSKGAIVGSDFFWAITDWMDATVGGEYLSERGWKPEAEWRYALDPLSDGHLQGSFLHDQKAGEDLWQVRLQQRQEFGSGLRALTQLDRRSARDLARRFSSDTEQETAVRTDSFGTLTQLFANSSLTLGAASYEGIRDSGSDETFRRLPSLYLEQFPTSLFGVAFFALETSYSRLTNSRILDDTPVQRLDLFPHLLLPLPLAPWLQVTASAGVRETFYDHDTTGDTTTFRALPDLRAFVDGPTLLRRYPHTSGRTLIHVIASRLAYRYVPPVRQADLPAFDTLDATAQFLDPLETLYLIDRIDPVNYAKFTLSNRLFAQQSGASETLQLREVASVIISQGFDLRAATLGSGQPLGPLDLAASLHFWERWWIETQVRIAVASGVLQEANGRLGLTLRPGWQVHVDTRHRLEPDILYVSGGVQAKLLAGLQVDYTLRYDAQHGVFDEHVATLAYQAQCWSVDLRLRVRHARATEFLIRANLVRF